MNFRNVRPAWGILALIISTTGIHDAAAFTMNLSPALRGWLGWEEQAVRFHVNYENCPISRDRLDQALERAFALWNSVPTSGLRVELGGETGVTVAEATADDAHETIGDTPVILCDPDMSATIETDADSIPGAANFMASSEGIVHGYLLLNAESGKRANIGNPAIERYIDVVVAHEVGHVLGLGHTSDTKALMYFDATAKEVMNLSQDDIDGMTYLYPRNELGTHGFLGCGTIGGPGGGGMSGLPGSGGGYSSAGRDENLPFAWRAAIELILIFGLCLMGARLARVGAPFSLRRVT